MGRAKKACRWFYPAERKSNYTLENLVQNLANMAKFRNLLVSPSLLES
ncbi:MAG: hypothetical protein GXZ17_07725 [Candidatus Atribacteria bacterium]|nr:hypothetical protein [Candidatus Atribacteria bacterium]